MKLPERLRHAYLDLPIAVMVVVNRRLKKSLEKRSKNENNR